MTMDYLLDIAKRYGLPFLLLCIAVWWQDKRLGRIENRLESCETEKFKIITQNNERSNDVIRQNTIALERNSDVLETLLGLPTLPKKRIIPLTAREGNHK